MDRRQLSRELAGETDLTFPEAEEFIKAIKDLVRGSDLRIKVAIAMVRHRREIPAEA